jgi:outer membrane biosynthesis protein TonB
MVPAPSTAEEQPLRISNDVVAPVVIRRVEPRLPSRMKIAGPLFFEMVIDKKGRARNIKILRDGTSPRLGPTYAKALEEWRFKPGTVKGKPVDVVFNLSVHIHVR